ncbi:hypothetical protein GCM10007301_05870 [Azorhizobium oxalatiphilum]|uniref:Methyltransferase FkbM domain-containing protein n=1 Tax=Azorhizobium oxalatiphilum TaxID=980631 RepID=A0A917BLU2_9HYPH|nr:FkbM family methyltransferase [Azorhizobium oxalatiphilum]GGF49469.1 hypothetical protein GCM10007301_05870 [Azorhizobium oxalatiphilum]
MTVFAQASRFIMDLGMNRGDNTAYYLARGYEAVAVEANPELAAGARTRFAKEIAAHRFTLVEAAVWEKSGTVTFHVNDANDHWSSVEVGLATRANSPTHALEVAGLTLGDLFEKYGTPLYLKVGVEGVDLTVLKQLQSQVIKPLYVSVEDCPFGLACIEALADAGYDGFKIVDLSHVTDMHDPHLDHHFPAGSTGPVSDSLPGRWMGQAAFEQLYTSTVRDRTGRFLAPAGREFHLHATKL